MRDAAVLIVARDAAATLARAITSALAERPARIVLVDDASADGTATIARALGAEVVTLPAHESLGAARQAALEHAGARFAVFLDADDEFLPGRVDRLVERLALDEAHIAADAAELQTDAVPGPPQHLAIPAFLGRPPGVMRLFERNYLPAPGPVAVRVDAARALGYDASLDGAEDVDLLLRALGAGLRLALVEEPGYRIHARAGSASRQLERQRAFYARALAKHPYARIERLLADAGASRTQTAWAVASVALFREDWQLALAWVGEAARVPCAPGDVLEPDGPCPRPEGWRVAFARGTIALKLGRVREALTELRRAERWLATPEGANNLGAGHLLAGERDEARTWFLRALERRPGYVDAARNLAASGEPAVTTHPLRDAHARSDYPLPPDGGFRATLAP